MHHFTCWTLFLESIEHNNSDLVQLAEHGTDDPEVVSSNPAGVWFGFVILDKIYFVLCNFRSVR